jgi:hypothetical protein
MPRGPGALLGKIPQRIASWTWGVTHERENSPADFYGGEKKGASGSLTWYLIDLLERIC